MDSHLRYMSSAQHRHAFFHHPLCLFVAQLEVENLQAASHHHEDIAGQNFHPVRSTHFFHPRRSIGHFHDEKITCQALTGTFAASRRLAFCKTAGKVLATSVTVLRVVGCKCLEYVRAVSSCT